MKPKKYDLNSISKLNDLMIWMVLPLLVIYFSYFFLLGKNCVFEINDQLDETLFTYVLNAKYLFSGVKSYPEMLGGVPKGGMSVSACLFIPLYRLFPVFEAFMIQYVIVVATAYMGMYLCVKELTGSGFIGFLCGGMFMFLPYQPVYGLSVVGGPLIFYAFLCLYRQKHVIIDGLLILYFALGANLVLLGYVALGFVLFTDIWILIKWIRKDRYLLDDENGRSVFGETGVASRCSDASKRRKREEAGAADTRETKAEAENAGTSEQLRKKQEIRRRNRVFLAGSLELLLAYIIINFSLFSELLLGSGGYVSHREEMVITGNSDFWGCVKDVFLNSAQHAFSFHQKLILPILVIIIFYAFRWKKWRSRVVGGRRNPEENAGRREKSGSVHAEYNERIPMDVNKEITGKEQTYFGEECVEDIENAEQCQAMYVWLVLIILINILTALFYGFCQSRVVVDFRNSVSGFFHYFSPQRVYWIYPTTWYVAAGLAAGLIWRDHDFLSGKRRIVEREEMSASPFRQTSDIGHNIRKTSGTGNNIWKTSGTGHNIWKPPGTGRKIAGDIFAWLLICAVLTPTAWQIRQNSIWILNKSQYKNNCSVGLMSWADYFAEDLMEEIDTAIFEKTGQSQEEYRVASLGMCPAVALEAGFYCIDGYSNNYSLEYKHAFREIIEAELEKCPPMKGYFDNWGSRCYLFTEESQNYYYLAKDADFRYEKLKLDTGKMRKLGCKYLFSAAEIEEGNADRMGLELFGVFDTKDSYYRVWVYEL